MKVRSSTAAFRVSSASRSAREGSQRQLALPSANACFRPMTFAPMATRCASASAYCLQQLLVDRVQRFSRSPTMRSICVPIRARASLELRVHLADLGEVRLVLLEEPGFLHLQLRDRCFSSSGDHRVADGGRVAAWTRAGVSLSGCG